MISYMTMMASLDRLRSLGPVFRSKEAVLAGVSWRDLYELRDRGELVELSRGLFQLAESSGTAHVDFVAVCARAPQGMICLDSALAYWDLTDEIPSEVHLAVPFGSHRPTVDHPPTRVHVFAAKTFAVGRRKVAQPHAAHFWITDRERTVVDAFRLRHLVGDAMAHVALRRYLRHRPKRARLAEVARELRSFASVTAALHVLDA